MDARCEAEELITYATFPYKDAFLPLDRYHNAHALSQPLSRLAWLVTVLGCVGLVMSILGLLLNVRRTYLSTFYSTKSGNEHIRELFERQTADERRLDILHCNKYKWLPLWEKVKDFINERLPNWVEQQPDWFDDYIKSTIPDEMIEDAWLLSEIRDDGVMSMMLQTQASRKFF